MRTALWRGAPHRRAAAAPRRDHPAGGRPPRAAAIRVLGIAIFDANWDGTPIAAPLSLMMGFHPAQGFSGAEYSRVDQFLDYADMHLASRDLGPVVYILLKDVTPAFPAP